MHGLTEITFGRVSSADVQLVVERWPVVPRRLAHTLMQAYSMPHEATQTMLIWHFNGPWKRTVLHKEGVLHNAPHPHIDLLEQTVDVKIRQDKASEIAEFDGSIIVDRTRGEMTAHCENERANTLLLNLAYEISLGKKTAHQAKEFMQKYESPLHASWPNPYEESLQFTSTIQANNPDMVTAEPN